MKNLEVDLSKDKKDLGGERGVCPYCGGENIDYDSLELEGEMLYFPGTCNDCGNEFLEWYDLEFTGQWGHPLKKKKSKMKTEVIVDEETGQREITIIRKDK